MKAPFRVCAIYDLLICAVGTILSLCGYLRYKGPTKNQKSENTATQAT
jgi:hypothetical protein